MHPFGAALGLPLGFEIGPELLVFLGVFAGEDEVTGTQAVGEGVEAHGFLTLPSLRTGGVLAFCRLASSCLSEINICNSPFWGAGIKCPYPIQ
jgi:hypothetical protein